MVVCTRCQRVSCIRFQTKQKLSHIYFEARNEKQENAEKYNENNMNKITIFNFINSMWIYGT